MKVNLRDFYPTIYLQDEYCDLPQRVVEFMKDDTRRERAWKERERYHKAYYRIERGEGIENDPAFQILSAENVCFRIALSDMLYDAMRVLSAKQARRIFAHYFLGMSKRAIAIKEGKSEAAIRKSIQEGVQKMKKYLENFF